MSVHAVTNVYLINYVLCHRFNIGVSYNPAITLTLKI